MIEDERVVRFIVFWVLVPILVMGMLIAWLVSEDYE